MSQDIPESMKWPDPEKMKELAKDLKEIPKPEYFSHTVMVILTFRAMNQGDAQQMAEDALVSVEDLATAEWGTVPWENARVVIAPRKGRYENVR
jgi:hypothetical protein